MKAARIHSFGPADVVVVEDVPVPSAGPNEVLVRVIAAGVAPWDAIIREGKSKDEIAKVMTDEYKWAPASLNMQWSLPGMMTELR